MRMTHKDRGHTLLFIVIPKNVQAILGLSACERLNLVEGEVKEIQNMTKSEKNTMTIPESQLPSWRTNSRGG